MRDCPVCEQNRKTYLGYYQNSYELYRCDACGHHYLDQVGASQAALDAYYRFDTSTDLQGADSIARLQALADAVKDYPGPVLDVGGKFSPLRFMLPDLHTLNAGERITGMFGVVILSHTLEHVYDVGGLLREITAHLNPGGRLVIEGPVWEKYDDFKYDFYWQHVNKFRMSDLLGLMDYHGFGDFKAVRLPDFLEFKCARVEGKYANG